jgi:hypothetical protein
MTSSYSTLTMADARREIRGIKEFGRKLRSNPAKARAFLIKAGILARDGKSLAPRYR